MPTNGIGRAQPAGRHTTGIFLRAGERDAFAAPCPEREEARPREQGRHLVLDHGRSREHPEPEGSPTENRGDQRRPVVRAPPQREHDGQEAGERDRGGDELVREPSGSTLTRPRFHSSASVSPSPSRLTSDIWPMASITISASWIISSVSS